MTRRTLVIRCNGCLLDARGAQRLLERLAAQPGVESVRIEALPLCATLRLDPERADEAALRGLVRASTVERDEEPAVSPQRPPRAAFLPRLVTRVFA